MVPYLLASIVYHENYLRENLSPNHPLFNARIFTDRYVSRLRGKAICGVGSCKYTGMQASGVPGTLQVTSKVTELSDRVKEMECGIKRKIDQVLTFLEQDLPKRLTEEVRSNFEITGMIQVTRNDISDMFNQFSSEMRQEFQKMSSQNHQNQNQSSQSDRNQNVNIPEFTTWC